MDFWSNLIDEIINDNTVLTVSALLLTYALVRALAPQEHRRLMLKLYMVGLHVVLIPLVVYLRQEGAPFARELRLVTLLLAALAGVGMVLTLIFSVLLPRFNLKAPRVIHDIVFALASVAVSFPLASHLGFDLSGLVATSAVLTAVLGFALQSTLNNVIGGLALQLDDNFQVGDWIEVDGIVGRIKEMRWRYTALETRGWETIVVPNATIMSQRVTIMGRNRGEEVLWRREVTFPVDYHHAPTAVIDAVNEALQTSPPPQIRTDPHPRALLLALGDGLARYGVRYWVIDIEADETAASAVRSRVYFALKRRGIRLALPEGNVHITETTREREEAHQRHLAYKQTTLAGMMLFRGLSEDERAQLAQELHFAPYARGEWLARQGDEGRSLFILTRGRCEVRVDVQGTSRVVAELAAPDFFGEVAMMTGARRSASVMALTDVECYRLDREVVERVIRARPEVADLLAQVLAERQMELAAVVEDVDAEGRRHMLDEKRWELLGLIQGFFKLGRTTREEH